MALRRFDSVLTFFEGGAFDVAVDSLHRYYAPGYRYPGSAFDEIAAEGPSDHYTASDIVAVSLLSAVVPARLTVSLLGGEADELLAQIPANASIWTDPGLLDPGGAAWRLWDLLDSYCKVGRTVASRLLAVKRPGLVPVFDAFVDDVLHFGDNAWAFWQSVARHEFAPELLGRVTQVGRLAGVGAWVTPLRMIDVVIWMSQAP